MLVAFDNTCCNQQSPLGGVLGPVMISFSLDTCCNMCYLDLLFYVLGTFSAPVHTFLLDCVRFDL